jgi:serine/threonine-protein kinase RsbW
MVRTQTHGQTHGRTSAAAHAEQPDGRPPEIEVRLAADPAYVALLRTLTAGAAARADLTLDVIEDLRIAVGEAVAIVLHDATGDLRCRFWISAQELRVALDASSARSRELDRSSFGWLVLSALVDSVSARLADGRLGITLSVRGPRSAR